MTNLGIAPLEPATPVGGFRLFSGDTFYNELDPPQPGFGDYDRWSDDEIEGFLVQGGDSNARAAGWAYMQLAASYAMEATIVRTDDLQVDLSKRATAMRELAKFYFDMADEQDAAAGLEEYVAFVNFGENVNPRAELVPYWS